MTFSAKFWPINLWAFFYGKPWVTFFLAGWKTFAKFKNAITKYMNVSAWTFRLLQEFKGNPGKILTWVFSWTGLVPGTAPEMDSHGQLTWELRKSMYVKNFSQCLVLIQFRKFPMLFALIINLLAAVFPIKLQYTDTFGNRSP